MSDRPNRLKVLPGGGGSHHSSLTLADFPLGSLAGTKVAVYHTATGRRHFKRDCPALSRSKQIAEGLFQLPSAGSLADVMVSDAHCGPVEELGAYLEAARSACQAADLLPPLADQIGVRLSRFPATDAGFNNGPTDLRAIGKAREVREILARGGVSPSYRQPPRLSETYQAMLKAAVKDSLAVASWLYEQGLSRAQSADGRMAMSRMLAALSVLKGRLPGTYAPIYQLFRDAISDALRATAISGDGAASRLANILENRSGFNLAQLWLEAMGDCGEPALAESSLRQKMTHCTSLNEPAQRNTLDLMVQVAGVCGTAYLDGLRTRSEEWTLVIAEYHRSPFSWTPIDELQWDLFPSATCNLSAERKGDERAQARVAIVPRLWIEALRDLPPLERSHVVLADHLRPGQRTPALCAAVAKAVARSCHKGLLCLEPTKSHEQWRRVIDAQAECVRTAREIAASVLLSSQPLG